MNSIIRFFDKLEDKTRIRLSHYPITYALIGGVGIVFFWKGTWETAEMFPVLHGPLSAFIGVAILLSTGLLVSFFVGDSIIISGVRKGKKLAEKTEEEVRAEQAVIDGITRRLEHIEQVIAPGSTDEPGPSKSKTWS